MSRERGNITTPTPEIESIQCGAAEILQGTDEGKKLNAEKSAGEKGRKGVMKLQSRKKEELY